MSEPAFILGPEPTAAELDRVAELLLEHGFALLPSDTAYSVAAIPFAPATRDNINTMLNRDPMPISLAFHSVVAALEWVAPDQPVVARLLERYCPGPITVICKASPHGIPTRFFDQNLDASNRTIGIRIPDSAVERAAAAVTAYPVTTVPVGRDPVTTDPVTDLATALEIVRSGTARIGNPAWCAIKGGGFYGRHSTVVEVTGDGTRVSLKRPGQLPFDEIESFVRQEGGTGTWSTLTTSTPT